MQISQAHAGGIAAFAGSWLASTRPSEDRWQDAEALADPSAAQEFFRSE